MATSAARQNYHVQFSILFWIFHCGLTCAAISSVIGLHSPKFVTRANFWRGIRCCIQIFAIWLASYDVDCRQCTVVQPGTIRCGCQCQTQSVILITYYDVACDLPPVLYGFSSTIISSNLNHLCMLSILEKRCFIKLSILELMKLMYQRNIFKFARLLH